MSRAIIGKPRSRKRQRGQSIYLALAAIIFLSLMTYAAFNISQMTHAKAQTMNAADAGAYTLAVTVARDLNFMAYTNRAMVANHAVIGQLTSLASLSNMLYLAARDIQFLQNLFWIPYVGPVLKSIGDAFERVGVAIEGYFWPALRDLVGWQNTLIQGISEMQTEVHFLTAYDMRKAEEVIKANDPELEWASADGVTTIANVVDFTESFLGSFADRQGTNSGLGGNSGWGGLGGLSRANCGAGVGGGYTDGWGNLSGVNNGNGGRTDALSRMREVTNLSRDRFTKEREWVKPPPVPVPDIRSSHLFHGGTQLSCDNKTWVGVDAFEMRVCWDPFNPFDRECETLGFWQTGDTAGSDGADDWRTLSHGKLGSSGHSRAYNNRTSRNPRLRQGWDGLADKYSGLQPYYELVQEPGIGERPSPAFVVLVYKPVRSDDASNITRTPNAGQTFQTDEGNPFHLKEGRNKIYGVAAAHAYFRRPAQNDRDPTAGRLSNELYPSGTYATLFAPYWQPRLTNLPEGIAAALLAADR